MSRAAHPAGPRHADVMPGGAVSAAPADLNALDPKVWPLTAARTDSGELRLGGLTVSELAREHGTPAYLVDEADWRGRARAWLAAFPDVDPRRPPVHYAGKSFLSKAVARWAAEEGLGLDVASGGELAVALAAEFPPGRITMHGNNKSAAELDRAVRAGVGRIVLDSFEEIDRLAEVAAGHGVVVEVMIRVTVGVEAHTHEFIATAHEDQKFGFALTGGVAAEAVRRVLKYSVTGNAGAPGAEAAADEGADVAGPGPAAGGLELVGLHSHIGSQIFDTAGFEVAAHRVVGLLAEIDAEHGRQLPEIDLGGGLGIAYTSEDDPATPADIVGRLVQIVARECAAAGLAAPHLVVEPGRAISGTPGITLYEVGTIKPVEGLRTYVSVDGGMSDNIRTALYDAQYTCALVSRTSGAAPMLSRVVGKHCESGDIVVRDAWLPADVRPGDLLAVAATGAYCRSMSSNYNHLLRPPVVAVRDGGSRAIVRRETEEDLLALDLG
ncbi:MAG TPA: diaminopimelate decarboxylase [Actinocrinis sp.]|nr:diaminopimelate decarboxylase [Actinocrinis sp.]